MDILGDNQMETKEVEENFYLLCELCENSLPAVTMVLKQFYFEILNQAVRPSYILQDLETGNIYKYKEAFIYLIEDIPMKVLEKDFFEPYKNIIHFDDIEIYKIVSNCNMKLRNKDKQLKELKKELKKYEKITA